MITVIQVIASLFALFAASRVILRLKDGNLSRREFIFWIFIWIVVIVVAFFPDFFTTVAEKLGIQRGVNLISGLATIILFYLVFRLYVKVETAEQEITKLVRQISIEKKKGKK